MHARAAAQWDRRQRAGFSSFACAVCCTHAHSLRYRAIRLVVFLFLTPCVCFIFSLCTSDESVKKCDLEGMDFLLYEGADLHNKDKRYQTVLHTACRAGTLQVVKRLVEGNMELNPRDDDGFTPLFWILDNEDKREGLSIAIYLVEQGGDPNIRDKEGVSIVHWAIGNLLHKYAEFCIERDHFEVMEGIQKCFNEAASRLDLLEYLLTLDTLPINEVSDGLMLSSLVRCLFSPLFLLVGLIVFALSLFFASVCAPLSLSLSLSLSLFSLLQVGSWKDGRSGERKELSALVYALTYVADDYREQDTLIERDRIEKINDAQKELSLIHI